MTAVRGGWRTGSIPWAGHAEIAVHGEPAHAVDVRWISRAIAEEAARTKDLRELRLAIQGLAMAYGWDAEIVADNAQGSREPTQVTRRPRQG